MKVSTSKLPKAFFKARKDSDDEFEDDSSFVDDDEDDEDGAEGGVLSLDDAESAKPKTLTRKEVLEILQASRDLSNLDLRKANLAKMDLSGANFTGSNLSYVNFKDSNLEGCNFSNSSLWNANLEGTNMSRTNLEDCDLDYTKMKGACFYRANVRRATLPTDLIPRDEIMRSVNEGSKINR